MKTACFTSNSQVPVVQYIKDSWSFVFIPFIANKGNSSLLGFITSLISQTGYFTSQFWQLTSCSWVSLMQNYATFLFSIILRICLSHIFYCCFDIIAKKSYTFVNRVHYFSCPRHIYIGNLALKAHESYGAIYMHQKCWSRIKV